MMEFEVTKFADGLGAEITGLDLRQPFDALDQMPTWDQIHAERHPEVLVVSNVTEGGQGTDVLGHGEASWHSDMSYTARAPTASILHAHEILDSGGDSSFLNMYVVLGALAPELLEDINGHLLNHDETHNLGGNLRRGKTANNDVNAMSGARHPVFRLLPESVEKALFLGRRQYAHIVDMEGSRAWHFSTGCGRSAPRMNSPTATCGIGRRADVEQLLHHAPTRSLRCGGAAHHAPDRDYQRGVDCGRHRLRNGQ